MSKRNYDPKYIKYGFTSIKHNAEILPECVVCLKTLCNAAMKPSLLKRHLERNHPNKMNADKSYFQRLADNVKRQRMDKTGQMQQKSKDVVAAYEIALLVAEQKQPHTIAESLILPGAKILVKRVFGEQAIAKLNAVSLSDNTIKRRIEEMSDDIADQINTSRDKGIKVWICNTIGRINRYYQLLSITCLCPLCSDEYNEN